MLCKPLKYIGHMLNQNLSFQKKKLGPTLSIPHTATTGHRWIGLDVHRTKKCVRRGQIYPNIKYSPQTTLGKFVGFDEKCDAALVYHKEIGQMRPFNQVFSVNTPENPIVPKDMSFLDEMESYKHCKKCPTAVLPDESLDSPQWGD
ncbi:unnamed protein product [Meganyctiphanes norvegica]|uniref:Uncharacterized protein n=1 Tax=Meganyctiphanes norvegica TaxID=48144 RepID=A0AAV2SVE1_MEGNR